MSSSCISRQLSCSQNVNNFKMFFVPVDRKKFISFFTLFVIMFTTSVGQLNVNVLIRYSCEINNTLTGKRYSGRDIREARTITLHTISIKIKPNGLCILIKGLIDLHSAEYIRVRKIK